ncbi:TPA: AAA family ATPase, partial [Candidatus Woesearchaeota archaeon]|nr:AAA family ATPase [Candidatus Woesearchaeota archaeon]
MIIGITGPICAGKGKAAEHFRKKGFVHHSFSMEIREVAKERKIEINRKNLTKLGTSLRKESPGKSILGQRLLDKIRQDIDRGASRWVVEGFRESDEVEMFRKHEFDNKKMRFVLIAVDAPQDVRWERMQKRGRHGEPETLTEFKKTDNAEMKG